MKFKQSRSREYIFVYHIGVYHAARDHEHMKRHMEPRVFSAYGAEYRAEEVDRAAEHEKQERMDIYLVYNRERESITAPAIIYTATHAAFVFWKKNSLAIKPNSTLPQPSRSTTAQQILL